MSLINELSRSISHKNMPLKEATKSIRHSPSTAFNIGNVRNSPLSITVGKKDTHVIEKAVQVKEVSLGEYAKSRKSIEKKDTKAHTSGGRASDECLPSTSRNGGAKSKIILNRKPVIGAFWTSLESLVTETQFKEKLGEFLNSNLEIDASLENQALSIPFNNLQKLKLLTEASFRQAMVSRARMILSHTRKIIKANKTINKSSHAEKIQVAQAEKLRLQAELTEAVNNAFVDDYQKYQESRNIQSIPSKELSALIRALESKIGQSRLSSSNTPVDMKFLQIHMTEINNILHEMLGCSSFQVQEKNAFESALLAHQEMLSQYINDDLVNTDMEFSALDAIENKPYPEKFYVAKKIVTLNQCALAKVKMRLKLINYITSQKQHLEQPRFLNQSQMEKIKISLDKIMIEVAIKSLEYRQYVNILATDRRNTVIAQFGSLDDMKRATAKIKRVVKVKLEGFKKHKTNLDKTLQQLEFIGSGINIEEELKKYTEREVYDLLSAIFSDRKFGYLTQPQEFVAESEDSETIKKPAASREELSLSGRKLFDEAIQIIGEARKSLTSITFDSMPSDQPARLFKYQLKTIVYQLRNKLIGVKHNIAELLVIERKKELGEPYNYSHFRCQSRAIERKLKFIIPRIEEKRNLEAIFVGNKASEMPVGKTIRQFMLATNYLINSFGNIENQIEINRNKYTELLSESGIRDEEVKERLKQYIQTPKYEKLMLSIFSKTQENLRSNKGVSIDNSRQSNSREINAAFDYPVFNNPLERPSFLTAKGERYFQEVYEKITSTPEIFMSLDFVRGLNGVYPTKYYSVMVGITERKIQLLLLGVKIDLLILAEQKKDIRLGIMKPSNKKEAIRKKAMEVKLKKAIHSSITNVQLWDIFAKKKDNIYPDGQTHAEVVSVATVAVQLLAYVEESNQRLQAYYDVLLAQSDLSADEVEKLFDAYVTSRNSTGFLLNSLQKNPEYTHLSLKRAVDPAYCGSTQGMKPDFLGLFEEERTNEGVDAEIMGRLMGEIKDVVDGSYEAYRFEDPSSSNNDQAQGGPSIGDLCDNIQDQSNSNGDQAVEQLNSTRKRTQDQKASEKTAKRARASVSGDGQSS